MPVLITPIQEFKIIWQIIILQIYYIEFDKQS